jgi:transcription initiation factor TFIID subunit 3
MKKHSKTGVESRFQGTVLGQPGDIRPIKIEGGPAESIEEWCQRTRERAAATGKEKPEHPKKENSVSVEPDSMAMES